MKKCILVLGMHRSGTSLLTGLLNIFGVYVGGNLIPGRKEDNNKGFFEHSKIVEINEDLLIKLGSSWCGDEKFPKNWLKNKIVLEKKEEIKNVILEDFGKLDLFALKDPRISVLLPLYLEVLRELKIKPFFIITKRDEINVARSLEIRNQYSLDYSLRCYERYYKSIENYTKEDKIYVNYDKLLDNYKEIMEEVKKVFKIKLRDFSEVREEVFNFVDKNLRHNNLSYLDYFKELSKKIFLKEKELLDANELFNQVLQKNVEYQGMVQNLRNQISDLNNIINDMRNVIVEKEVLIKDKIFFINKLKNQLNEVKKEYSDNLNLQREERLRLEKEILGFLDYIKNIENSLIWSSIKKLDKLREKIFSEKINKYYFKFIQRINSRKRNFFLVNEKVRTLKKRILFINHEESKTGAPKVLFDIAKKMKNEFEVVMVSLDKGTMHEEFVKEFGEIVYPPKMYEFNDKLRIARKIIGSINPDVVYANSISTYSYAIEARKQNISTIFHIHELEEGFKWGLMNVNKKYFNNWADKFIAVSDNVKGFLINKMKCDESKIELINAFVSFEEILKKSEDISKEDVYREINKKEEEKIILSIGEVGSRKGTDLFIEAHKILKKKGYKFKFVWIGSMRFKDQIKKSYKTRDMSFLFLGEKQNPFPYISASDIFVLSSREDPFPLVALESMVLGKPIVAFKDSGGMPEVIEGCCGVIVEEMNAESLANSIENVFLDMEKIKELGEAGRKIQKENYDSEIIMRKIDKLIKSLVKNGR